MDPCPRLGEHALRVTSLFVPLAARLDAAMGANRTLPDDATGEPPRPGENVTDRLTGEESPQDVPAEAAERARQAERALTERHEADPPDRPISES